MSIPFNNPTGFNGIVQQYEKEIGANQGDVSGNTPRLKEFTADANLAFDDLWNVALPAAGTWQLDDSNHDDVPIFTTPLVAGQRDYALTADADGNLFLEFERIFIKPSGTATNYVEIFPKDQQSERGTEGFNDGANAQGVPCCYDKTGNVLSLDPIPSYSVTAGIKFLATREASYFTPLDTSKKPGVPGIFHRWFAIRPAEDYARRNNLSNYPLLRAERQQMEKDIAAYFGRRERDVRHIIKPKGILIPLIYGIAHLQQRKSKTSQRLYRPRHRRYQVRAGNVELHARPGRARLL